MWSCEELLWRVQLIGLREFAIHMRMLMALYAMKEELILIYTCRSRLRERLD